MGHNLLKRKSEKIGSIYTVNSVNKPTKKKIKKGLGKTKEWGLNKMC